MKQPNPFKDAKASGKAPRYYSGDNPLERDPPRPSAPRAPARKANAGVPISQRGGG